MSEWKEWNDLDKHKPKMETMPTEGERTDIRISKLIILKEIDPNEGVRDVLGYLSSYIMMLCLTKEHSDIREEYVYNFAIQKEGEDIQKFMDLPRSRKYFWKYVN